DAEGAHARQEHEGGGGADELVHAVGAEHGAVHGGEARAGDGGGGEGAGGAELAADVLANADDEEAEEADAGAAHRGGEAEPLVVDAVLEAEDKADDEEEAA